MMGMTIEHAVPRSSVSEKFSVVMWATIGLKMKVGGTTRCHRGLRQYVICEAVKQVCRLHG